MQAASETFFLEKASINKQNFQEIHHSGLIIATTIGTMGERMLIISRETLTMTRDMPAMAMGTMRTATTPAATTTLIAETVTSLNMRI